MTQCVVLPVQTTAGLSFQATADAADYPAPDWTLTLHLRGPASIDLTADADGVFAADAATTAAWAPGTYWWTIRASQAGNVVEVETGDMIVLPDMVAANGPFDGRSEAQKSLDAIEAVLAKRATLDQERYRINNRELYRTPIGDLIKLRTFYAAQVRREKARASGASTWGRPVHVRFS